MSFWDYVSSRREQLWIETWMHASAVFQCMVVATVIGVALAIATYRSALASRIAIGVTATILTVPSFALLGLLIPMLGLGVAPTVVALVLYALLPIVRNAIVGLAGVDPQLVDAARGIGMNRVMILLRVELPLAWPALLTGIRVSTQMIMGIAAIAAYVSGPGLGNEIFNGLARLGSKNAINAAWAGTLGVVVLALLFDAAYVLLGRLTVPRGIRG
ncbi:ABC transporter permease [Streptomyces sp. SID3343]|uniref:ABC transporter permease n=1 Tax=Streptomyces sp. SID3343 TaxID=2690260 RepID=UPI001367AB7F|nr:ABC transporter permease [Streptomyces sp. SID3343]MYW05379.1 ABC transporter permease subunit [Streptomyces sp. SID3343]